MFTILTYDTQRYTIWEKKMVHIRFYGLTTTVVLYLVTFVVLLLLDDMQVESFSKAAELF